MANIKVNDLSNLNPTGTDLFDDPESFMVELSDEYEQAQIAGGTGGVCRFRPTIVVCTAVFSVCGPSIRPTPPIFM